jgi:major vault protein
MKEEQGRNKELVLAPGTYAYMQDTTKGQIKVFTGPTVINQSAQETPVLYNPKAGTFDRVDYLQEAINKSPIAVEGYYLVLFNPSKENTDNMGQPDTGQAGKMTPELEVGRRINIPGPCMFPLWPGQHARYIRGHHLRSNQYLIVRVYNEDEARQNWTKAVVKPATTAEGETVEETQPIVTAEVPEDLSVGRLFIIRGTEVSFYIPPTGVTVVEDPEAVVSNARREGYVRDALTLERLEYCILVSESGDKRYEKGPQVVFPKPTEKFIAHKGEIKSRAIELNEIQGIHVKVISPYSDTHGDHKEGDELFITGKETAIYYPREEHSLISYDGKSKHFATAVPAGEARYVMDRITGEIKTVPGPAMLLPDPRKEVIIRRVLSANQCGLWYPDNEEALSYNEALREVAKASPTTRSGVVSEGEISRSVRGKKGRGRSAMLLSADSAVMEKSLHGDAGMDIVADEFTRASTYTQPRTVTLNTKFQGVPNIDIWTGYAVMVVSKTGKRHPEVGPKTVLLGYDEYLEVLKLSTGKPKTTDRPFRTAFLRVKNNKVTDIIDDIETADHVRVKVKISYNTDFTGDPQRWWDVENYVKFLCDHARSVLKNTVRKVKIADFYANAEDFIRNTIVGDKGEDGERVGMTFDENGMKVTDVEVLFVQIVDESIQHLLEQHQHTVVRTNIELKTGEHNLEVQRRTEQISQEQFKIKTETDVARNKMILDKLVAELTTALKQIDGEVQKYDKLVEKAKAEQDVNEVGFSATQDRQKREADLKHQIAATTAELERQMIAASTEAVVSRFGAAQQGFTEGLMALSSQETMVKVAESMSVQNFIGGKSFVDVVGKVFAGSPAEGFITKLTERIASVEKLAQGSNGGPSTERRV